MSYFKPESCPKCCEYKPSWDDSSNPLRGNSWFIKKGYYRTKHNGQYVPRYQCKRCLTLFSSRTHLPNYRHKKPKLNPVIYKWYCSGTTQNRIAKNLDINRKTVARKLLYLSHLAHKVHNTRIDLGEFKTNHIQYDDMETFEHTLAKPISIAIAVCTKSGHIIDMNAATMKSHGRLSGIAMSKYGFRADNREVAREDTLLTVKRVGQPFSTAVTDKNTHYLSDFARILPEYKLVQVKRVPNVKGAKSRRNKEDALWRVNHVCAKLRSDLARLARRTWVTNKKMWSLQASLDLYTAYNNGYRLI